MPPRSATAARPSRQARALANDERIYDAAMKLAAQDGWAGLVPTRIASVSGLVRSTVQERCRDRSALGAATWNARCAPTITAALTDLLSAAGLLDGTVKDFPRALRAFYVPSIAMRASAELLVVAHFDDATATAVRETIGAQVTAWCSDGDTTLRARRGYLILVALGLLLASRREVSTAIDFDPIADRLLAATRASVAPQPLPRTRATHLAHEPVLAPGDPALNALLNATLQEIGLHGFEAASIDSIARAANYTKGLVFSRYPTKLHLFLDASHRLALAGLQSNEDFQARIAAEHGLGIAEATMIREMQRPQVARPRAILAEQTRLAWHHPELMRLLEAELRSATDAFQASNPHRFTEGDAQVHFEYSLGLGAPMLPLLFPDAQKLAYDVMTVPMNAA